MNVFQTLAFFIMVALILAMPSCTIGTIMGESNIRREAIKNGVAEYYIDADTLKKEFRWLPSNPIPGTDQ